MQNRDKDEVKNDFSINQLESQPLVTQNRNSLWCRVSPKVMSGSSVLLFLAGCILLTHGCDLENKNDDNCGNKGIYQFLAITFGIMAVACCLYTCAGEKNESEIPRSVRPFR